MVGVANCKKPATIETTMRGYTMNPHVHIRTTLDDTSIYSNRSEQTMREQLQT